MLSYDPSAPSTQLHTLPLQLPQSETYYVEGGRRDQRPVHILRHIGLLEADEDKIQKIRPKGTLVTILYVPREAIWPSGG